MGLLLNKPIDRVDKSLRIPFESWKYLKEQEYGKTMSESYQERIKNSHPFSNLGYKYVRSSDMGFSLEEMKRMLDEAGLPWEDGPEIESCDI